MRNHLDLLSLKVDNNNITLNVIDKYTDVRKQSSRVTDWRQVNGVNRGVVINRQKMQMPRITYDDASTHGKFMHGAMVREWDFKFARFMDPALTTDWVRLL